MRVWNSVAEWQDRRRTLDTCSIGLVPTMGALHRGHVSLIERCRKENKIAVVSIFVNPTQFDDPTDLERYPCTLEHDLDVLESAGVDDVFAPSASELYPDGYRFRVEENCITRVMEGIHRPGFLQGVMTVVLKLLNLVRADRAYFGEKDYQQLKLVTDMARDFFVPTEIVPCATVRDASGLAESSRNRLLSPSARDRAAWVFRALTTATDTTAAKSTLESSGFSVAYVEEHWRRRFAAASIDGVRLIDNVPLA